ncbi:MAG: sigma-70 family RNA polymerase sigma factor [Clostridia bacterium]|nr:sigma-70 family RNA polymerase sigma factor [Clostridia bacterium]
MPEQVLEQKEIDQKIDEAINQLDDTHREVIILKYFWGLSEKEMAEVINVKDGTVKSRLNRARAKIQSILIEYLSEKKEWR